MHRGTRTFSVSSDKASLDSFSFRLSLEDRFHRTPAETTCVDSTVQHEDPSEDTSFHSGHDDDQGLHPRRHLNLIYTHQRWAVMDSKVSLAQSQMSQTHGVTPASDLPHLKEPPAQSWQIPFDVVTSDVDVFRCWCWRNPSNHFSLIFWRV